MKKITILVFALVVFLSGCGSDNQADNKDIILSQEEAKSKVTEFINNKLLPPNSDQKAVVEEFSDEDGLYKMKVTIGDKQIDSFMTKNGKNFFPQVIDMLDEGNSEDKQEQTPAPVASVSKKSDKPVVDLFIMSHCPYGTQIEKGALPVARLLGDKIDFNIKFVDYAMHQKKEIDEQLIQYCIDKEEPAKFLDYLDCFLEKGDNSEQCIVDNSINKAGIDSCVAATDEEFKITEDFNNKETWRGNFPSFNLYKDDNVKYGITGSPGLVINEEKVKSGRSSAALLDVICSAFNEKPSECEEELSSQTPSPGFGGGTGSDTDATCD